jgi:hypothetical protein
MPFEFPNRLIVEGEPDTALVRAIQQALADLGYGPFTDGRFDAPMTAVVKQFQAQHADLDGHPLAPDGKIGRLTWGALFGASPVVPSSAPSTLMLHALAVAGTQVGQMEEPPGSNRGPMVDHYLQAAGIDPVHSTNDGRAWCMAFVYWTFQTGATSLGVANPLPRTAGCLDHWNRAAQIPGARRITAAQALDDPGLIKPGLIFILDFGHGLGHCGFVERLAPGGRLATVEGNSNTDGSRNGVGVFRLLRRGLADPTLKGFVDYTNA